MRWRFTYVLVGTALVGSLEGFLGFLCIMTFFFDAVNTHDVACFCGPDHSALIILTIASIETPLKFYHADRALKS